MSLRSILGQGRDTVLSTLHRRAVSLNDNGPIVTFTFDDFPRTALNPGADILEGAGVRGTYYVAMGLMGSRNNLGEQFQRADILTLIERGHEVGLHGYQHLSARRSSLEDFVQDVARCRECIRTCSPVGTSTNFAYPYGEATLSSKKVLGPQMTSSRGTIPGLNGPDVDMNLLHANPLYGDMKVIDKVRSLIQENGLRRSWLIFYSHDVASSPSPFGCTPSLLRESVLAAVNSGARILTVSEVVKLLPSDPIAPHYSS